MKALTIATRVPLPSCSVSPMRACVRRSGRGLATVSVLTPRTVARRPQKNPGRNDGKRVSQRVSKLIWEPAQGPRNGMREAVSERLPAPGRLPSSIQRLAGDGAPGGSCRGDIGCRQRRLTSRGSGASWSEAAEVIRPRGPASAPRRPRPTAEPRSHLRPSRSRRCSPARSPGCSRSPCREPRPTSPTTPP